MNNFKSTVVKSDSTLSMDKDVFYSHQATNKMDSSNKALYKKIILYFPPMN